MSGEKPDLAAPAGALELIAKGINGAHAELKELGMIGEATTGRGFTDLALSGLELGHAGLTEQFETFCERWEWGVRSLMQRGNGFAMAVGLSAGGFAEQERYVKDTMKIGVNSLNGNPHLTEDEVKAKSWDEISTQTVFDNPDYSAESFSKAHAEVKQTWQDTTYDVEDAMLDSMERSGVIDEQTRQGADREMREMLDPSDEAVKQAEQPTWGDR
jgi:hypothetical protein